MSRPRRVVLDASALLAWVLRERNWHVVDKMLDVAMIPVSALVETLYRAAEKGHRLPPAELYESLLQLGVEVESVRSQDAVRAAELIASSRADRTSEGSLSLGDGLALAVAERLELPITGGDQHWETLDLSVRYLPFR